MIIACKHNLPVGILKGIEQVPAEISLGRERCPMFASFANHVSSKHRKALLSMPFVNGAKSVVAKAKKTILWEKSPRAEKTLQMSTFLPLLPPPGRRLI
jgi:hypothetical protein